MEFGGARKRGRPEGAAAANGNDNGGIKKFKPGIMGAQLLRVKETGNAKMGKSVSRKERAKEHMQQLQRLQEKDPEFYRFLKENDEKLLDFNDEDVDVYAETDADSEEMEDGEDVDEDIEADEGMEEEGKESYQDGIAVSVSEEENSSKNVITSAMVDSWCKTIKENTSLSAVRSLMRAFRTACHYGDEGANDPVDKLRIISSSVFNKLMLFVLNEMDGILRALFKLPHSGEKKETVRDLMNTKQWKNNNHLVQSYLGNSLHVLYQMTDTKMISFTLRRLRYSSIFLAAFPALLRKYIKVVVHFWATGGDTLPVICLLFLRDLCIHFGSDCTDDCFKGMYKAYVLNCQYVTGTKLQHIRFLGNCFAELLSVDLGAAYQHAFIFIRQLAMILNENFARRKKNKSLKELFRKVYSWKFMNCLELWTGAICAYSSDAQLKPLGYPLSQVITGTARLVPTAQYFPLRLWCIKLLNRIAASTDTFIPVAIMLLDMLDIKGLHRPATGGVGEAVDFRTVLKVKKSALKTRSFQEACVFSVIEELTQHLANWSYSAAFYELSFVPVVRLHKFCKSTKIDRFRREIKQLIRQIEANCEFTNKKRMSVQFIPNNPEAASFLEDEKRMGSSPLSQYAAVLRERAQQRSDSVTKSSVLVGENTSIFWDKVKDGEEDNDAVNEEGATVFNSSWLPGSDSKTKHPKEEKKKKQKRTQEEAAFDEDVVEDLILSSDEEEVYTSDSQDMEDAEEDEKPVTKKHKIPSPGFADQSRINRNKSLRRKSKRKNKRRD